MACNVEPASSKRRDMSASIDSICARLKCGNSTTLLMTHLYFQRRSLLEAVRIAVVLGQAPGKRRQQNIGPASKSGRVHQFQPGPKPAIEIAMLVGNPDRFFQHADALGAIFSSWDFSSKRSEHRGQGVIHGRTLVGPICNRPDIRAEFKSAPRSAPLKAFGRNEGRSGFRA